MTARKIRVLVVDDSVLIREMICDRIKAAEDMEVAGSASDGQKALQAVEKLNPDVVTLDIQMPNMDGLATLDALLNRQPVPVIMISALTQLGADTTLEALDRGALDYIAKPESGAQTAEAFGNMLLRKVREAARADVHRILRIRWERKQRREVKKRKKVVPKRISTVGAGELADKCIAIGISTGGPPALASLFETLQPPMPPIVVVQHMPAHFTKPLSWRLDAASRLSIKEAQSGDCLRPNHVLIARGGRHLQLRRSGKMVKAVLRDGPPASSHKPSVDVTMKSAVEVFGAQVLGVIMTGMGRDGSDGCGAIRAAGGYVLGQDGASSDVYGMNKVAMAEGHVNRQFGLGNAAAVITRQVNRLWVRNAVAMA